VIIIFVGRKITKPITVPCHIYIFGCGVNNELSFNSDFPVTICSGAPAWQWPIACFATIYSGLVRRAHTTRMLNTQRMIWSGATNYSQPECLHIWRLFFERANWVNVSTHQNLPAADYADPSALRSVCGWQDCCRTYNTCCLWRGRVVLLRQISQSTLSTK